MASPATMLRSQSEIPLYQSKIRRKPIMTYKSPSPTDVDPFIMSPIIKLRSVSETSSVESNITKSSGCQRKKRLHDASYSLPLYHPLGELALSLPLLDPTQLGLPLPVISDDLDKRIPSRAHQPTIKARDSNEGELTNTVVTPIAITANEGKRGSPRKKRVGVVGKRRRKDTDDGDATYPAKRTRQTRGGDDNEVDVHTNDEGTPEADSPFERRPERRSARSQAKRRDSSDVESVAAEHTVDGKTKKVSTARSTSTSEGGDLEDGQMRS